MKVIICGAGQVGFNLARYMATEHNDITVIDQSAELIQKINDNLDVQAITGFASQPDVLEQAGANSCDLLIAVTLSDEVNMVACQVAHTLFNVPTKIARVRNQSYLSPRWAGLFAREQMPIDHIISPEIEVAHAITRRLEVPGALDMIPLHHDKVKVIGVLCGEACPVINTPLRQLTGVFPDLHIEVVAIVRNERMMVPSADDEMLAGDEVYFVAASGHVDRAMAVFGFEEMRARRIVILGGGNIGQFLARDIEARHPHITIRVVEADRQRAQFVAQRLNKAIVLHGDGLDPDILTEANVGGSELFVAVSNLDEVNILASVQAKRLGCRRTVTLINKAVYSPLVTGMGIDAVVNPRAITVSRILQHVRRGRIKAVHSLRENVAQIIEAEALETSRIVGLPLAELKLPKDTKIGAIIRNGEVIIPRPTTTIRPHDHVVLLAMAEAVKKVERLFQVSLEYFA
jgi:trk system potassium uptake protein